MKISPASTGTVQVQASGRTLASLAKAWYWLNLPGSISGLDTGTDRPAGHGKADPSLDLLHAIQSRDTPLP